MISLASAMSFTSMASNMCTSVMSAVRRVKDGKSGDGGNQEKENASHSPDTLKSLLTSLENYVVSLQSLLIWENPYLSAAAFITINLLYWLIVLWSRRFYSIVCLIFFCVSFYKLWSRHIWPEIRVTPPENQDTEGWLSLHPAVLSAPEISHYLNECGIMFTGSIRWLIDLRRNQHGFFCILVTTILLMTAFIGKIVPGVIIVYTFMMTVALGPGVALYVIPPSWFAHIGAFIRGKDEDEEDETNSVCVSLARQSLPQLDIELNQDDERESSLERTLESSLGLLSTTHLESFNEEDEMEYNELDEMKIDHSSSKSPSRSPARSERSSQCSSCANGMHFVSTHFSRNSSSDDIDADYEMISDSEVTNPNNNETQSGSVPPSPSVLSKRANLPPTESSL